MHDWHLVSVHPSRRWSTERCDCGAVVVRIGVTSKVSQGSCTMAPAGAERSSTS